MLPTPKVRSLVILSVLFCGLLSLASPLAFFSRALAVVPVQMIQASRSPQIAPEDIPEEVPEDELAPAALRIDLSAAPPIIRTLYQATRETKESDILARLEEAKRFVESGTDLHATDSQGRTALHWAVFGSSYSTKPKVLVAYEELTDGMIGRGVDINHEDAYQNTALDYLIYAPTFEMQTLLLEHGANSGFLAGVYLPSDQCSVLGVPVR